VINVYAGPDKSFSRVGQTMADQSLEVIGVAPGSAWLRVCCVGGEPVWLEAVLVEVHGALDGVTLVASGTRPAPLAATRTPVSPDAGTEPPATAPSPAPTPTRTTTPTSSQPPPACRGEGSLAPVTLLSPRSDLTCNGPVSFSWQWQDRLWAGETFEIHIWPELKQNRNGVKRTSGNSVTVNLREDVLWIDWNAKPHRWEIIVVCASTGRWISRPSEARLFYYWPLEPFGNDPARNCK
jgi:hypothetical protein